MNQLPMSTLLSTAHLSALPKGVVQVPTNLSYSYPVKVLQFGTGVLLRGLPDYYIHKANQQGVFEGRIAVVKSTKQGDVADFAAQDNLYTINVKGLVAGNFIDEYIVNNAIKTVIDAQVNWAEIKRIAVDPLLSVVISNTTEAGIVYVEELLSSNPPESYPAKLLSLLHHRYVHFEGNPSKGLVILPTELISHNAEKLVEILCRLSDWNQLSADFKDWLVEANDFCNTLVDRIVPGKLRADGQEVLEELIGAQDKLSILVEPYRLWAIEVKRDRVREKLSFATVDETVILVPSIEKYKELKLRLLNGAHSFCCGLALLAGFRTVKEAMSIPLFKEYVYKLMQDEIGVALVGGDITAGDVRDFANAVVDRFSNPYLDHKWTAIAQNYTAKMDLRCLPIISVWRSSYEEQPQAMALGLAGYLVSMRGVETAAGYSRSFAGEEVSLADAFEGVLSDFWAGKMHLEELFAREDVWHERLESDAAFLDLVRYYVQELLDGGVLQTLATVVSRIADR